MNTGIHPAIGHEETKPKYHCRWSFASLDLMTGMVASRKLSYVR
jgi:hypothetical protein